MKIGAPAEGRVYLCPVQRGPVQRGTLRLKLLQIGALIRIAMRNVWVSLPSGYPFATLLPRPRTTPAGRSAAPQRSSAPARTKPPTLPSRPQLTPSPLLTNVHCRGEKSGLELVSKMGEVTQLAKTDVPQGLKPLFFLAFYGTAEAVP